VVGSGRFFLQRVPSAAPSRKQRTKASGPPRSSSAPPLTSPNSDRRLAPQQVSHAQGGGLGESRRHSSRDARYAGMVTELVCMLFLDGQRASDSSSVSLPHFRYQNDRDMCGTWAYCGMTGSRPSAGTHAAANELTFLSTVSPPP
jgi:hypothetical protein